jgi:hypothetical protein
MQKEISILLPSLRPEALAKSIQEFADTNSNVDYEIVVVSPFEVKGTNVVWIKEETPKGSVLATNIAYSNSCGEYKMYFSDDVSPTKGCLRNMINFMNTKESPFVGAFKMIRPNGGEIGPFGAYNRLYACYGCVNGTTISKLNGLFDSSFEYSWVDIDLSLRCWLANGKVEICKDAIVIPRQIDDELYRSHRGDSFNRDVETFLNKWHSILGEGYIRNHEAVNKRLN